MAEIRVPVDLDLVILRHACQRPSRWRLLKWLRWMYERDQLLAVREHLEALERHPSNRPAA